MTRRYAFIRRFVRAALPVLGCAALPSCGGKSTFVDLQIRGATTTPKGIARLVVTLDLGGKAAETQLSEKDGSSVQLPTSASFEVRSGAGALTVSVSAQDAAGIERDHGAASGSVAAGETTQVDLQLQGSARQASLTVQRIGKGVGRIVSTPAGIDCGAVCSAHFDVNTPVTLTATTDFTSTVSGWSSCAGAGSTCPVVASSDQIVTVSFNCDFPWVVDAAGGADANAGGCAAPFKTITKALGVAAAGDSVAVRPGLYDAPGNGESFPLAVPAGVALVGDEPDKGNGAAATTLFGGGAVSSPSVTTVLYPAASATVAGFTITCAGGTSCAGILPQGNAVTIRNNTITGNATYGIEVANNTTSHLIVGNVIENSGTAGIGYVQTTAGGKAERNVIRKNQRGVEYDTAGGDLGGGPSGSAGGNVLSCNTQSDVWTSQSITLNLRDNQWDHAPPAQSCSAGGDLCSTSLLPTTFDAAGATVAASPCP